MRKIFILAALGPLVAACAQSSIMDAGGGDYVINARASVLRGGGAGYGADQANAHCARVSPGSHAIISQAPASGALVSQTVTTVGPNAVMAEIRYHCGR